MPYAEVSGVKVNFPYDPYPCQVDYMGKVIHSLQTGSNAILESPTGTGKTLCLLCASLAWLENKKAQIGNNRWKTTSNGNEFTETLGGVTGNDVSDYRNELTKMLDAAAGTWKGEFGAPKIIYASRTHSQLNQAMQEFKKTSYRYMKACVIGSREQLCIHPQVMKESNNTTKVHLCKAKVSVRSCHFYNQVETCKTQVVNQVLDIEDLVSLGHKNNICPYYLSKELKKDADIIFMPYNYILDPKSRRAHGVELQGNILIFDEAHNLERICEESASFDLSSTDLASAISDVNRVLQRVQEWQSTDITGSTDYESNAALDYNMEDVLAYKNCLLKLEAQIDAILISEGGVTYSGDKIFSILSEVGITLSTKSAFQELTEKMLTTLANDVSSTVFTSKGGGLAKFGDVMKVVFSREPPAKMDLRNYIEHVSRHYKVYLKDEASKGKKKADGWGSNSIQPIKAGRVLSYWCFNPGYTMADLISNGVKAIILTSGTLSPLQSFISEFGIDFPVRLENPHVIDKKQVWIGSLEKSPNNQILSSAYENRFKEEYMCSLGYTIVNFAKIIPKGLLVFFPSYPLMEKCLECWQNKGIKERLESCKQLFVEPKNKIEFTNAMSGFYEKINDPSLGGAIFVAVCRGKVSEGLDFADNNGRGVIITGLPYPPMMDARVKLKMQFLDDTRKTSPMGLSGQDWYRQQASRAVNQAIGRVIRHRNDFGVIILCDSRFSRFKEQLPIWLRSIMGVHRDFGSAQREIKQFFKAYEYEIGQMTTMSITRNKSSIPTLTSGSFELAAGKKFDARKLVKASTVVNHFDNTIDDNPENLFEHYSRSVKGVPPPTIAKKSLFSALDSMEGFSKTNTTPVIPIFEKLGTLSSSLLHMQQSTSKTEKNKKIIIQNNLDHLKLRSSASDFLTDVKKIFSSQTYAMFKTILDEYKHDSDLPLFFQKLQSLFNFKEPANLFVVLGICKFIRPAHRQSCREMCQDVIGQPFIDALKRWLPQEISAEVNQAHKTAAQLGPPSKKLKSDVSKSNVKIFSQTLMNNYFTEKKSKEDEETSSGVNPAASFPSHMDSNSHMQTSRHLSSEGMKLSSLTNTSTKSKPSFDSTDHVSVKKTTATDPEPGL